MTKLLMVVDVSLADLARQSANKKGTNEMTKKLMMMVAAVAVAIGARAETETVGGRT